MKDRLNNIFSDSECISEETMYAYIENKLTSQERRIVEVHLASCELCSDALEGLSLVRDKEKIRRIVSDINEKITAKNIAIKPKSFWINYRYSIAAALAFLIISGGAYIMITNNKEATDQKVFAEKFKPFPNEVTKEKEGDGAAAAPDVDKGPEAQTGKDVSKGLIANGEQKERNLNDLEETTTPVFTSSQKAIGGQNDRYTVDGKQGGKFRNNDSSIVNAEITSKALGAGDVSQRTLVTTPSVMTDSVSVTISGDQMNQVQDYSAAEKSVYKNADIVSIGATKSDKQEKSKTKSTPAKEATGGSANQTMAFNNAKSFKKGDANKSQSTALPAPNMSSNGVFNFSDNNNNIQGAKSNSTQYYVDNRTSLDTAMKKYEDKDYGGAVNSYEEILVKDPDNYDALFYSGVSYLSLDKPGKAIVSLNKVLKIKDGKYYEAAQWYKALALIKLNDDKEAKKLLQDIISNGKTYKSQANDTFNQLK